MKTTFRFACVMMIFCFGVHAAPWRNTGRPDELSIFPHSLCNSDFICTGTPTSTNDGHSAEFAVDEILWGSSPSTNIIIRYFVEPEERYKFQLGERYLVCAFTNDWWAIGRGKLVDHSTYHYYTSFILSQCVTETNRPPDNAVFDDYVVLDNRLSSISFKDINYGGTNYWDLVRTFTTNIIDIAKREGDYDKVGNTTISIVNDPQKFRRFPSHIRRHLRLYKLLFYDYGKNRMHQR